MRFSDDEIFTIFAIFDVRQGPKIRSQKWTQKFHPGVELAQLLNYTETRPCKLRIGQKINFQLHVG